MKHRYADDYEVNPFNAGEPTMPSDDDSAWHEDESCNLSDDGYVAPSKKRTYKVKAPYKTEEPYKVDELRKTEALGGAEEPRSEETPVEENLQRKETPRKNVNSVFRIIIIVFFAAVVAILGLTALDYVVDFASIDDEISSFFDDEGYDDSSYSSDSSYDFWSSEIEDAEEASLYKAAEEQISTINSSNQELKQLFSNKLSKEIESSLSFSTEDLGLNTDTFIEHALDASRYEITNVFAFDEDGDVFADAYAPNIMNIAYIFEEEAQSYLYEQGLLYDRGSSSKKSIQLTDEEKEYLQTLFDNIADNNLETSQSLFLISATKNGENWVFDESQVQEEIAYTFGVSL